MRQKTTSTLILFILLVTCASISDNIKKDNIKNNNNSLRTKVVNTAFSFENKALNSKININGENFTLDCSGSIAAIFYSIGIDVTKDYNKYNGNGVKRLFLTLKNKGLLITNKNTPLPGDVIFWDNTYDKNEDGYFGNDPLTHAGIVVKIENDGTIHYLHANYYTSSLTIENMNLQKTNIYKNESGKILNHVLYSPMSKTLNEPKKLSGELYNASGNVLDEKF